METAQRRFSPSRDRSHNRPIHEAYRRGRRDRTQNQSMSRRGGCIPDAGLSELRSFTRASSVSRMSGMDRGQQPNAINPLIRPDRPAHAEETTRAGQGFRRDGNLRQDTHSQIPRIGSRLESRSFCGMGWCVGSSSRCPARQRSVRHGYARHPRFGESETFLSQSNAREPSLCACILGPGCSKEGCGNQRGQ